MPCLIILRIQHCIDLLRWKPLSSHTIHSLVLHSLSPAFKLSLPDELFQIPGSRSVHYISAVLWPNIASGGNLVDSVFSTFQNLIQTAGVGSFLGPTDLKFTSSAPHLKGLRSFKISLYSESQTNIYKHVLLLKSLDQQDSGVSCNVLLYLLYIITIKKMEWWPLWISYYVWWWNDVTSTLWHNMNIIMYIIGYF